MSSSIYICNHDVLLTCCLQSTHGVSGHLFEIIEYLWLFRQKGVDACALIPFTFSEKDLDITLARYRWPEDEKNVLKSYITIKNNVKILRAKTAIFVDGILAYRAGVTVLADRTILLRCAMECNYDRADLVLQDSRLYEDLPNSQHYVKKVLTSELKPCKNPDQKVGLVYATRACRELDVRTIEEISKLDYDNILVLSEFPYNNLPENFKNLKVPVQNIFDLFTDFLYTPVGGFCDPFDCSPRLPVECRFFGKGFKMLAPLYRGLDVRLRDIEHNFKNVDLSIEDDIFRFLN